ncbi:MAG: dTDP-4-dehydrorhamnose reductase [Chloroflexi bacterium]|nr:MAG: dTDP-4-dehydrorhamnose reductase [Chloroflexota bacterium]
MKALVFGAGGQLGTELVRLLGNESGVPHERLSITDAPAVEALIAAGRPDVVFNCAAYNEVDRAESASELAHAVNAAAPHNVALACNRHGAALVHFSTNFVFDGRKEEPYVEVDEPSPLSVYGRSKLEGERQVLQSGATALIIRTAAVFGGGVNFPMRILGRARFGERLRIVADQKVNPTYAKDLAAAAVELWESGVTGIVHAAADGCVSWDEFARAVLADFGVSAEVESVATTAFASAARRPANGCLATTRYRLLRPWRQALKEWSEETRRH